MRKLTFRRDIADIVLEALDVAASRRFAHRQTFALILEILAAERPDISLPDAQVLVGRMWRRLAHLAAPDRHIGAD